MIRRVQSARAAAWVLWAAIVSAAVACPLAAADFGTRQAMAGRGLTTVVPQDAGLCVVARELATDWDALRASELGTRWQAFPPALLWQQTQGANLMRVLGDIERLLGVPWPELRTWAGSREAVIAVWPVPSPKPGESRWLLVCETTSAERLESVVDRLAERVPTERRRPWEGRVGTQTPRGWTIHPGEDKERLTLVALDAFALVSNDPALIQDAAARLTAAAPPAASLATLPAFRLATERLAGEPTLTAFVQPRVWDASLEATPVPEAADKRLQRDVVIGCWKQVEFVVAGVELGPMPRAELHLGAEAPRFPSPVAALWQSVSGQAALLPHLPAESLVAVAGRFDWRRWVEALAPRLAPGRGESDAAVHDQPAPRVDPQELIAITLLSGVGPDMAAYVVPTAGVAPPAAGSDSPATSLAAVGLWETRSLQPGEPPLAEAFEALLRTAFTVLATAANAQHAEPIVRVETSTAADGRLTSLRGWPTLAPVEPTFLVDGSRIWLGTSADAVRRAIAPVAKDASLAAQRLTRLEHPRLAAPGHVVYLNLRGLRESLAEDPGPLAWLARVNRLDEETAQRSRRQLGAVVGLADELLFEALVDETGLSASLTVSAEP